MTNNGWRALIYDAEWARFKKDQEGVIVSEDGRMCETVDDNRDNILIEADPNFGFSERESGHILFRQKGTDLFDIVCLKQDKGGQLNLNIVSNKIEMNICNGDADYNNIYKILNDGNLVQIKINYNEPYPIKNCNDCENDRGGDCYCIKTPTYEEFMNAVNELQDNEGYSKEIDLIVTSKMYGEIFVSNTASLILKSPDSETRTNERSVFNFSNLKVTTGSTAAEPVYTVFCDITPSYAEASDCNPGKVKFSAIETTSNCQCKIIKSPNKDELTCDGGTVYFAVSCTEQESDVYYMIDFKNCSVQTVYDVQTCFKTETRYEDGNITSINLNETEHVRFIEMSDWVMKLYIDLEVDEFSVRVSSLLNNHSCNAIFVKDNNGNFKISNPSCTSLMP